MFARSPRLVLFCLIPALLLGAAAYTGLIKLGLVRNPFAPVIAGDIDQARNAGPGVRILFVGNSFTSMNDMPGMVDRLAAAEPDPLPLFVVSYTLGGSRLSEFADDGGLRHLLGEAPWNIVVLQEQSQIPSLAPADREQLMDQAVRSLDGDITGVGARTELFMTWGYSGGDGPGDSYQLMQDRLAAGYTQVAEQIHAPVVPVGLAWAQAHRLDPQLALWAGDGRHPTREGSYLAARVMYAALTGRDPSGNRYLGGIAPATAHFLQQVATATAL